MSYLGNTRVKVEFNPAFWGRGPLGGCRGKFGQPSFMISDSQICLVLKILILGSAYMLYLFRHITFFFSKNVLILCGKLVFQYLVAILKMSPKSLSIF